MSAPFVWRRSRNQVDATCGNTISDIPCETNTLSFSFFFNSSAHLSTVIGAPDSFHQKILFAPLINLPDNIKTPLTCSSKHNAKSIAVIAPCEKPPIIRGLSAPYLLLTSPTSCLSCSLQLSRPSKFCLHNHYKYKNKPFPVPYQLCNYVFPYKIQ